ncbi:uncharacterized protein LOC133191310 [Saccostrea echinata]|uniref:uncharacterized protein LOC133191310 n=1 Tax=Saccostrea echinata TaxID=191078 RepID=UPI002A7FE426|nr:uncharacterized protein LOC133191310 [Saccostrea echinata]
MTASAVPIISKPITAIIICTLITRVLTVGYVIGGFVIKFYYSFLDQSVVYVLDHITIGALPLGSTLMFLIYSLMPFLLLYSAVGLIGLVMVFKRKRFLLITHAVSHLPLIVMEIVYLSLISWIMSENEHATSDEYELAHTAASDIMIYRSDREKWTYFFGTLKCCNVTGQPTYNAWVVNSVGYVCYFSTACLDVIQSFITTYGSFYLAVISVNIIASCVSVAVTEYIYRMSKIDIKDIKERIKYTNGILADLHRYSVTVWQRNKILWISGFLKIFDIIYETALGISLLILTFSWLRDYYLKDIIWKIWKDGISMGYLEYILTITFLCVLLVSIILKFLNFFAIYRRKRIALTVYIISEFFVLVVEVIILIFFTFLIRMLYCCLDGIESYHCQFSNNDQGKELCSNTMGIWDRATIVVWLSFGFLVFHLAIKTIHLVMADRIFKAISPVEDKEPSGFIYFLFLKIKRSPLAAANIGVGVFIMVFSTIFLCGLLTVRYDQQAYSRITDTLHGIFHNGTSGNVGTLRDVSYIMMAVTLNLSFLTQIPLFMGLYLENSKILIIIVPLRLVYCCLDGINQCEFYSDKNDLDVLCSGGTDLWVSTAMEIWLFWTFTLVSFLVQIASIALCNRFYKKTFTEKGIFTISMQFLKNNVIRILSDNPVTAFIVLTITTLIVELSFGIAIYIYFFLHVYTSEVQNTIGQLYRHIYNIQYLMNGLAYTMMVIIPLIMIARPILLWLILFKRKLQASYFFVLGFLTFIIGEIVMLVQSSIIMHLCCSSCRDVIYNVGVINVSFITLHLFLNVIYVILVDRIYPFLKNDKDKKGVLKIVFTTIWDSIKSLFIEEKVLKFFTAVQALSLIVDMGYGITVYTLYFINFSPINNDVQQDLGALEKHRYDMQDLLNALSFTLMSFIPVIICFRGVMLFAGLHRRPVFIYIIISAIFVICIGEIVLLVQSSYLMDMAYGCFDRSSSDYVSYKYSQFCDTNLPFVFDIVAVFISYLVIHIVLNVLSMIILDKLYKYAGDKPSQKSAFVTAFGFLYTYLKTSKLILTYFVFLLLMLIIRLLFWIGLLLMGLTPGYIHTDLLDAMCEVYTNDLNYGRTALGLMYSHMAIVPLDIACHCFEFAIVLKMSKQLLTVVFIIRLLWIFSDVICLALSSIVLNLVCSNVGLLYDSAGIMVAYIVTNFCSHVLEIVLSSYLIKKRSNTVGSTDTIGQREEINPANSQGELIDIE